MLEIHSKDTSAYEHAEEYYNIEKLLTMIKLNSVYGMMVTRLTDEEREAIRQAYESGDTHVYFDTDSSQLGG